MYVRITTDNPIRTYTWYSLGIITHLLPICHLLISNALNSYHFNRLSMKNSHFKIYSVQFGILIAKIGNVWLFVRLWVLIKKNYNICVLFNYI